MADLGSRIRELRKARDLTQRELAARAGLSEISIKTLEAGKYSPRGDTLDKLAAALGIKVSELLGEADEFATPVPPVPTWRRLGVSEDRIAQAAAIWADLTPAMRASLSGHLQNSALSLAAVDTLIEQVQVRLDTLKAQVQAGKDPPAAADPIRPEDTIEPEGNEHSTRHTNLSSILGLGA